MKILMINPSSSAPEAKREYILGIPYLISALKSKGYDDIHALNYFNLPWSETKGLTVKALEDFKPDIVMISCFTINRIAGVKSAVLVKNFNPSIKVVMGGMHPNFLYEQILTHYPVDAVCIGEGEETVVELVKTYEAKSSMEGVMGIAFKKNGIVVFNGRRDFIKDIDSIPFPAHYIYADDIKRKKTAHIITSRGCPYGCQFCSTTEFWGRFWRARSPKNVIAETEMLVRDYDVNYISFQDDEFTLQKKRTIDLCKEIVEREIKIKWSCNTRVNTIDMEQLEWMKKAGCDNVSMGIESGSPKILKTIGKKITVEQIIKSFKLLEEFGIARGSFLMVGNPGEDSQSVKDTIELIRRLNLDVVPPAVAEIYPGTQLYEIAKKRGFITDDYWLTEDPPPFYTVEHSAERLQWWAFLIGLSSKRLQGNITAAHYLAWFVSSKRRKVARYFARIFKKALGLKKGKYTHKEY